MPSENFWPLSDEEYLDDIPHDDSMNNAPERNMNIFFMDFSPMYMNNISYLRNLI